MRVFWPEKLHLCWATTSATVNAMSVTCQAIPGGWTEREVPVGPHVFRLLTPADPDALLERLIESPAIEQRHFADPYWGKLWPAAVPLAETILRFPSPGSCLELGCGSGLAGLAALAAGWEVTFSDYVPLAVDLALENAARNGLQNAKGLVLDWRRPGGERFAMIVASDVTYDAMNFEPLLDTLDRMLAPGGQAWLGDAGRGPAAKFLEMASRRGWAVDLFDERDEPATRPVLGRYQRIVLRR